MAEAVVPSGLLGSWLYAKIVLFWFICLFELCNLFSYNLALPTWISLEVFQMSTLYLVSSDLGCTIQAIKRTCFKAHIFFFGLRAQTFCFCLPWIEMYLFNIITPLPGRRVLFLMRLLFGWSHKKVTESRFPYLNPSNMKVTIEWETNLKFSVYLI